MKGGGSGCVTEDWLELDIVLRARRRLDTLIAVSPGNDQAINHLSPEGSKWAAGYP